MKLLVGIQGKVIVSINRIIRNIEYYYTDLE